MSYIQFSSWQIYDDAGRRKYITEDERRRFILFADTMPPAIQALSYVLAFTGCRISEGLSLTRPQLDAERSTLTIRTLKRRRVLYRVVPVPETVTTMLLALPTVSDGRWWTMHRTTAWRHIARAMAIIGVHGPAASCKGLRHGFGIRAAGKSVPPNLIQKWLGHASGTTTAIYLDAVGFEEREFAGRMW